MNRELGGSIGIGGSFSLLTAGGTLVRFNADRHLLSGHAWFHLPMKMSFHMITVAPKQQ